MQTLLHDVLAEWREAERAVAAAAPGTVERAHAEAAVERLTTLYRDIETAMRLGVHDRGTFRKLFDDARLRPET